MPLEQIISSTGEEPGLFIAGHIVGGLKAPLNIFKVTNSDGTAAVEVRWTRRPSRGKSQKHGFFSSMSFATSQPFRASNCYRHVKENVLFFVFTGIKEFMMHM